MLVIPPLGAIQFKFILTNLSEPQNIQIFSFKFSIQAGFEPGSPMWYPSVLFSRKWCPVVTSAIHVLFDQSESESEIFMFQNQVSYFIYKLKYKKHEACWLTVNWDSKLRCLPTCSKLYSSSWEDYRVHCNGHLALQCHSTVYVCLLL